DFRRILEPKNDDVLFGLVTFLDRFDIRTAYPLLLHLLDASLTDDQWRDVSKTLESYLLRRAVCDLTTKGYNRVFLTLTRTLRAGRASPETIRANLSGLTGESGEWPRDESFQTAWQARHAYQTLQNPKIVHILERLNGTYLSSKSEDISIQSPLTVEHILPQDWIDHWPLPTSSSGLTPVALRQSPAANPR